MANGILVRCVFFFYFLEDNRYATQNVGKQKGLPNRTLLLLTTTATNKKRRQSNTYGLRMLRVKPVGNAECENHYLLVPVVFHVSHKLVFGFMWAVWWDMATCEWLRYCGSASILDGSVDCVCGISAVNDRSIWDVKFAHALAFRAGLFLCAEAAVIHGIIYTRNGAKLLRLMTRLGTELNGFNILIMLIWELKGLIFLWMNFEDKKESTFR